MRKKVRIVREKSRNYLFLIQYRKQASIKKHIFSFKYWSFFFIMHFTSLTYTKLYSSTFWSFLQRCLSLWIKASVKWLNANIWFTNLLYHHFPPKNTVPFFLGCWQFLNFFILWRDTNYSKSCKKKKLHILTTLKKNNWPGNIFKCIHI